MFTVCAGSGISYSNTKSANKARCGTKLSVIPIWYIICWKHGSLPLFMEMMMRCQWCGMTREICSWQAIADLLTSESKYRLGFRWTSEESLRETADPGSADALGSIAAHHSFGLKHWSEVCGLSFCTCYQNSRLILCVSDRVCDPLTETRCSFSVMFLV